MSPAKFNDQDHSRKEINGRRPSPLKINRDSHSIQKPSSSFAVAPAQQKRQPVIIYTHSPKVIHTQARDFMALVQKLTGLTHREDETTSPLSSLEANTAKSGNRNSIGIVSQDDNDSSSVVTDDNNNNNNNCKSDVITSSSSMLSLSNPYFGDIPLFTPGYRFPAPDTAFASPNMGVSISPSVLEFIRGMQEY